MPITQKLWSDIGKKIFPIFKTFLPQPFKLNFWNFILFNVHRRKISFFDILTKNVILIYFSIRPSILQSIECPVKYKKIKRTLVTEHVSYLLPGKLPVLAGISNVGLVGYLKTNKGHVGRVAQGSKLVYVKQALWGALLSPYREVAKVTGCVTVFLLTGQLSQQDLK